MDFLNYHHLRYFWVVAREGGLRKAAEKLHVSQPTISAHVANLEEELGVPLFDRYSIMRYWNDSGAFDLTSLKNDGLYEKIHQCIGGLLADFVVRATSLEEFKGAAK